MSHRRRPSPESGTSKFQLGSFLALACIVGLVLPLSANIRIAGQRRAAAPGEIAGITWTGNIGISETVDQLMARQRLADARPARPYRVMPEHEVDRSHVVPDPEAPAVSQWPEGTISMPAGGPDSPQTLGTAFTGATLADAQLVPPDSMGTVGPTQYVVFINGRIRTFNKTTGVADSVINADPDTFFASVLTPVAPPILLNFTSDPQVRYDRLSGRWFMSIIDVPCTTSNCSHTAPNRWLLAVSDAASGGTITGSTVWTKFFFQPDATNFCDYPSLGVDANALYTGCNMFTSLGFFAGTNGYVVRKSSVLSGGPIVVTAFPSLVATPSSDGPYTPRGVDNFDPASTEGYFIGVSNAFFGKLILRRVSNPGGTPTISGDIALTVPATSDPIDVPHLGNTGGTAGLLDAIDERLFAAHLRNGRLWTAHTIGVLSNGVASSTPDRDAARWYELQGIATGGTFALVQSGTIFDSAASNPLFYWMPTVTVSGQGHAAFGFSQAGANAHADAATVGRLSGDALGTTETIVPYTSSTTAYNPGFNRWGDYSFTSLDPLDDMTMWTIQEFCDSTNSYGVRVVKLIAPPPATPSSTDHPGGVAAGLASVSVVVTGTSTAGSGFYDPGANLAAPALPFSHIGAAVAGGVTVNSVTYNSPTSVTLNLNTIGATTGQKNVTVTNPDGQSRTGVNLLTITAAAPTATPTVTPTATATRTVTPTPTPPGAGVKFFTVTPCRILDTRNPAGPYGGPALSSGATRTFVLAGQCTIPSGAIAVAVNMAVTQSTNGPGFLTLYPAGTTRPLAASMNYSAGQTRANNAIVPLGVSGDISVFDTQGGGTVQLILDVNGYFK